MVGSLGTGSSMEPIKTKRITFLLDKSIEDRLKVFQSELLVGEKDLNWNFTDVLHGVLLAGLSNPKQDVKKAIIKYKKET